MKKLDKKVIDKLKESYQERYLFNVKEYGIVEKKGKFDYISWSYCEMLGNIIFDDFSWTSEIMENGKYVKVIMNLTTIEEIEIEGKDEPWVQNSRKTRELLHPNLNHQNKPVQQPDSFNINTTQMRAMSKLFSMMTGIGLSLYTGEDLPKEEVKLATEEQVKSLILLIEDKGRDIEEVLIKLKVDDFYKLSQETISGVIKQFKVMKDEIYDEGPLPDEIMQGG